METEYPMLTGIARIAPERHELRCSLDLLLPQLGGGRRFTFMLHQGLQVQSLTGEMISRWEYLDSLPWAFSPEGRAVRVHLGRSHRGGDVIRMSVAYSGQIGVISKWEVNRITPEWVELGLYSPWFPLMPDGPDLPLLEYDLKVMVEGNLQVMGAHRTELLAEGWRLVSGAPSQDVVLLAAPEFHTLRRCNGGVTVTVHLTGRQYMDVAADLAQVALYLLEFYREWFSDQSGRKVNVVIAPRSVGGGYVRGSFMVLSEATLAGFREQEMENFKWLAHEIAHLWWNRASSASWEDWLNESVAEYCALRAVADRYSEAVAGEMMGRKRERMEGLPPVMGLERTAPEAVDVLYGKGCVLLDDLSDLIGEDRLTALLTSMASAEALSTEVFLTELSREAGGEASSAFEKMLRA